MKKYIAERIETAPNWTLIPALEVNSIHWLPDAGIRMTQQVCYNERALFIHQCAVEPHIRAELNDPLAPVCEDSCMEFFFCPSPGSDRYFNFEWNPNSCLYLGLCSGHGFSVRLLPKNTLEQFDVHTVRTADGWEICYQIPLSFISLFFPDFRLTPGSTIRANCYKCGDKTVQPHYLSWNPCSSETPNFHQPSDFGIMIFGK